MATGTSVGTPDGADRGCGLVTKALSYPVAAAGGAQ